MEHTSGYFISAMMGAMLVLAAPAFVLCAGIAFLAFRKRRGGDEG